MWVVDNSCLDYVFMTFAGKVNVFDSARCFDKHL